MIEIPHLQPRPDQTGLSRRDSDTGDALATCTSGQCDAPVDIRCAGLRSAPPAGQRMVYSSFSPLGQYLVRVKRWLCLGEADRGQRFRALEAVSSGKLDRVSADHRGTPVTGVPSQMQITGSEESGAEGGI